MMPEDANSFSEITSIDNPRVVPVNRDGRSRAFRIRFSADGPMPHIHVVLRSSTGEYVVNEANIVVRPLTGGAASYEVTLPRGVLATGDAQVEIAACRAVDLESAVSDDWIRLVRDLRVGDAVAVGSSDAAVPATLSSEEPNANMDTLAQSLTAATPEPASTPSNEEAVGVASGERDQAADTLDPESARADQEPAQASARSEFNIYFKRPQNWRERVYAYFENSTPPVADRPWPGAPMGDVGGQEGPDWYVQRYHTISAATFTFNDGDQKTPPLFRDRTGYYYTDNRWYDANPERVAAQEALPQREQGEARGPSIPPLVAPSIAAEETQAAGAGHRAVPEVVVTAATTDDAAAQALRPIEVQTQPMQPVTPAEPARVIEPVVYLTRPEPVEDRRELMAARLTEAGIASLPDIAALSRDDLVARLGPDVDIANVDALLRTSRNLQLIAYNRAVASGFDASDERCVCNDCDAAISPASYLADLISYSLEHLQRAGTALSAGDPRTPDCAASDETDNVVRRGRKHGFASPAVHRGAPRDDSPPRSPGCRYRLQLLDLADKIRRHGRRRRRWPTRSDRGSTARQHGGR